jgi:hypothetical protein
VAAESSDWRWADADGVQNIVDEWELVSSLSSGSLPHYTLVWKTGWQTWLPACQVAELASAIPPDKAESPVAPQLEPGRTDPPPPPLDKYAAYQTRDAASRLLGRSKAPTRPPQQPRRKGARGAPPPPAMRPRTPLPTLVEPPSRPATATLRPPGAVPPPPRGVPVPSPAPRELVRGDATQTPIPAVPASPARKFGLVSARARREEEEVEAEEAPRAPEPEPPTVPIATPGPIEVREKPVILMPEPSAPEPELIEREASERPAPISFWVLLGAGGLGILAMIVVALVLGARDKDPVKPVTTGSARTPKQTKSSTVPCTLGVAAKKLAPSIFHGIPPYLSQDPGGTRIAVGYAASENEAVGITIDPETLDFERKFNQQSQEPITGVVPVTAGGKLSFSVDRESSGLRFARSIDAKPPITIGVSDDGFASVVGGGVPRTIWPGGEERRITEPRVARVGDIGYVVTFRRGGQTGEVVAGWLGLDASRKSELSPVATSRKLIGTPVLSANDREILVAFSARPGATSYWGLQVATAAHGQLPKRAHPFSIPPGGLGAEAISPAVAGLDGGRWILQWTEGSTGNRQVRLQTLASDLIPIGDALTLSPGEVNAGQGVVWVRGDRALSLFLVKVASGHELWGAGLKCP